MIEDSLGENWKDSREPWLRRICIDHHLAWDGLLWLLREGHLSITTNDETTTVAFRDLGALFHVTGDDISLGLPFTTACPKVLTLSTDSRIALVVQDAQELLSAVQILDMYLRRTGFLVIGHAHHYLPDPERQLLAQSARYCCTALEEGRLHLTIGIEIKEISLWPLTIVDRKVEFDVSEDERAEYRREARRARSNFVSLWLKDQKDRTEGKVR